MKMFGMFLLLALALVIVTDSYADTWVNGYTKSNGTYVQGHYRSSPDSTVNNNWSTRGNVNPYTGVQGTRNPSFYGNRSGVGNNSRGGLRKPANQSRSPW